MNLPFEPRVLEDSIADMGTGTLERLTTFLVPFPTVKLAELRTHRTIVQTESEEFSLSSSENYLSMNANSSRAIPLERQIKQVEEMPFEPIWTMNQKGMSGKEAPKQMADRASQQWHSARAFALTRAKALLDLGIHKQDAALLLNPFSWTVCLLTASDKEWIHFFNLRCDDNVYPAVRVIAEKMRDAMGKSTPRETKWMEWHLAFSNEANRVLLNCPIPVSDTTQKNVLRVISMSMCAMISYDTHQRQDSILKHVVRAIMLIESGHWSTAEHQYKFGSPSTITNLRLKHWESLRSIIEGERKSFLDTLKVFVEQLKNHSDASA
jgi:thymidylate synthase ThyX